MLCVSLLYSRCSGVSATCPVEVLVVFYLKTKSSGTRTHGIPLFATESPMVCSHAGMHLPRKSSKGTLEDIYGLLDRKSILMSRILGPAQTTRSHPEDRLPQRRTHANRTDLYERHRCRIASRPGVACIVVIKSREVIRIPRTRYIP